MFETFRRSLAALGLAAALSFAPAGAAAQSDMREVARKLAVDLAEPMVTVRVVVSVKVSYGGEQDEREQKNETNGMIVAPDGTTIVPLSEIDPSQMFQRMMGEEARERVNMDSNVKDLKIVINKTNEIAATVVQRDADLDLAVIRPAKKQEQTFKTIDLENTAEPKLLDECFVLGRMGRIGDYVVGAMTGEVQAVVTKPRTFYIPSAELASGGLGVPAFNAEGKLIGVVLNRVLQRSRGSDSGGDNSLVVIMPAADLKEIIGQEQKPAN